MGLEPIGPPSQQVSRIIPHARQRSLARISKVSPWQTGQRGCAMRGIVLRKVRTGAIPFGTACAANVDRFILKRIPSLHPVSFRAQCEQPALVAGGRSLLRDAFSPLTTCGAADLRRSKLHTLVELQPTASSASGVAGAEKYDLPNPVWHKICAMAGKRRKKFRGPEITASQVFQETLTALGAAAR